MSVWEEAQIGEQRQGRPPVGPLQVVLPAPVSDELLNGAGSQLPQSPGAVFTASSSEWWFPTSSRARDFSVFSYRPSTGATAGVLAARAVADGVKRYMSPGPEGRRSSWCIRTGHDGVSLAVSWRGRWMP